MEKTVEPILHQSVEERQAFLVKTFSDCFGEEMQRSPEAWRGKFRKMSASPFAFYRGSAAVFYADMQNSQDPFLDEKTSRVWIQGDLHAENFGTYLNGAGLLVFDVNDFDEAYVGPFTWDLKRLAASLALIGYQKALSDAEIEDVIATMARAYARQVTAFAEKTEAADFALTIGSTTGKLKELLLSARLKSRLELLESYTVIENYDRKLARNKITLDIDQPTREKVEEAFDQYLKTIPKRKRRDSINYRIKDIAEVMGVGIGSAGFRIFSILLEGPTQTLENDVIISMKQGQIASPSRAVNDPAVDGYFKHNGHRTVLSQRALQAYADPMLGHTEFEGTGFMVSEFSPYTADLDWGNINKLEDILEIVAYLGQAVAKIHCISDEDSDQTLVPYSIEEAIYHVMKDREDEFVAYLTEFGMSYGNVVRDDYRLFVDAFRNRQFAAL